MTARSDRESGFTIIEVVVAALVLTMGALATFGMLSAATKNTYRAKQTQVALDMAQQELEALRGLTTEEVALTSTPPHSSNIMSPNYRVNNGTFAAKQSPLGEYRNLVVNGGELYGGTEEEDVISGGVIEPGPTSFNSGDLTGKIYRYVVWRNDERCPEATCPGTQDYKQVIVAVKMDKPGNISAQRGYVEVQSDFIDPLDSKSKDPSPGSGGKVVTAQQFYLTDTPCSSTGTTTRQEITGNHLLHNTLGTCANGLRTGSTKGAPDALVLGAPPDPDPANVNIPELFDYSDDSYLEPTPNTDKGVQIRRDDTNGCHYVPSGVTTPQSQVHRWVSDPMSTTFKMTKYATLEFYTRALNDELYPAQLCVYLFKRQEVGSPPIATDTLLINQNGNTPYWTYMPEKTPYWPQNEWKRVRLKMSLKSAPYTLLTGDRLGVALSVERQRTTPADAIAVMYDHPTYPTRLEVETETPIGG
jgi:type II secretory pathway pseudopilin PulG